MMLFTKNGSGLGRRGLRCFGLFFLPGPLGSERGNPVGYLFAGGRQLGSPCIDSLQLIKNEVSLICMQLADLQGHDPSLPVGKNREREDRIHAECGNRIQSILFADQHRIIDAHLVCVVLYRIAEVYGDADDFHSISGAFMPQGLQQRDFAAAGGTPGRPEVDQQGPSLPLGQGMPDPVAIRQGDVWHICWDGARWGGSARTGTFLL